MSFLGKLFGEKKQPTLEEDLRKASVWIAEALNTSGYRTVSTTMGYAAET